MEVGEVSMDGGGGDRDKDKGTGGAVARLSP